MSYPITLEGTTRVAEIVGFEGNARLETAITLRAEDQTQIEETHVLFMAPGGYVLDVKDEVAKVFGVGPTLPVSTPIAPDFDERRACAHVAVHMSARRPGSVSILERGMQVLSFASDAHTRWPSTFESKPAIASSPGPFPPPPGDVEHGLMIGLMGRPDVVDLVEPYNNLKVANRTLILSGMFINLLQDARFADFLADPRKDTRVRWHATLRDHSTGSNVIDRDLPVQRRWPGFSSQTLLGAVGRFAQFHYALPVPSDFTFGLLQLELRLDELRAIYRVEVQLADVDVLHLPLDPRDQLLNDKRINFGNGPGEPDPPPTVRGNGHNGDMTQRYAYDLGVRVANDVLKPGRSGGALDGFWVFGEPVLCVADGTVIRVVVSEPDAVTGTVRDDALGTTGDLNRVVVRHDRALRPRYSVYGHCRQNSAVVAVGDVVKAGQKLAEVGSNGPSGEPHLHLAYYEFDEWGVLRMLPMAFTVSDGGAGSVTGVPRSNQVLEAPSNTGANSNRPFTDQFGDLVQEVADGFVAVGAAVVKFVRGLLPR